MGTYPIMHINHSHGRSDRIRTCDPCIPNALLCQLSYTSIKWNALLTGTLREEDYLPTYWTTMRILKPHPRLGRPVS